MAEKKSVDELLRELGTSKSGLSGSEAAARLKRHGRNELEERERVTAWSLLSRQLTGNVLLYVLIAADLISYVTGEMLNVIVLTFIVGFIIVLGFFQEYKAENAVRLLKQLSVPVALVMRDGASQHVPSADIVPGDIVVLETGDRVPADAVVLEQSALRVDEAALTGESFPVEKQRNDTLFAGTFVVNGKAKALVYATGMRTKIGHIAEMIQVSTGETLLQRETRRLAKLLTILVFAIALLVFVWGMLAGVPLLTILIIAIVLAVAGVPEGLPLTLTLAMVLGMQKMARRNAIVRKILAVETVGSVTAICVDKTGTLTTNEMTVEKLFVNNAVVDVSGSGYAPKGTFTVDGKNLERNQTFTMFLTAGCLCNNAELQERRGSWAVIGDPTEGALLVLAAKAGLTRTTLEAHHPRNEETVFTSERKMMSTLHTSEKGSVLYAKGAPEFLLAACTYIEANGLVKRLTAEDREAVLAMNKQFASSALRVLGIAYKKGSGERDLVFLGLAAMRDPPRPEVRRAIETCRRAGIRVIMITGDNEHTAKAIAKDIGLAEAGDEAVTGSRLDAMSDTELEQHIEHIVVYARTFPEHKMRIVSTLKSRGYRVAMTGDGINDAPAIKKADVGIAMGIRGTDVTKEAADIVLADDNFATIVSAVGSGRAIHENIQKITYYLVSTTLAEVFVVFFGIVLFGFEAIPLLALQVLLVNMVTEEMPALALGIDTPRKNIMERKDRERTFLTGSRIATMVLLALLMTLVTLAVFSLALPDLSRARTMALVTLIVMVAVNAFSFKSLHQSAFRRDSLNNRWLLLALLATTATTLAVVYVPQLQLLFSTVPLAAADWLPVVAAAVAITIVMEAAKWVSAGQKPNKRITFK